MKVKAGQAGALVLGLVKVFETSHLSSMAMLRKVEYRHQPPYSRLGVSFSLPALMSQGQQTYHPPAETASTA
jgi:hypothetical protein